MEKYKTNSTHNKRFVIIYSNELLFSVINADCNLHVSKYIDVNIT